MGSTTGIEWTDSTWSPVKGCTRVSPGCVNCYAETLAGRFCGPGLPLEGFAARTPSGPRWTGRVELAADRLDVPVRWTKPRRIFVNSQSDTFHETLSNDEILAVFGAMAAAPHHTFQVLTKRARRLPSWFAWLKDLLKSPPYLGRYVVPSLIGHAATLASKPGLEDVADRLHRAANDLAGKPGWIPLANVHIGVSVESQEYVTRIPYLLEIPAAKRFLSIEPLLGPVDIRPFLGDWQTRSGISWVIVGGESGPNARPMHPAWVRDIRDACQAALVPFFFKQWGEWQAGSAPPPRDPERERIMLNDGRLLADPSDLAPAERYSKSWGPLGWDANIMSRVGKKNAGAMLDGREWKELPS